MITAKLCSNSKVSGIICLNKRTTELRQTYVASPISLLTGILHIKRNIQLRYFYEETSCNVSQTCFVISEITIIVFKENGRD